MASCSNDSANHGDGATVRHSAAARSHRHRPLTSRSVSARTSAKSRAHDVSDSNCPNYDTTTLEEKATGELSNDDFVGSMGDFASSAKFRIECMKSTAGFSHYKQEAYAAVDSYGIAEALKLGHVGTDNISNMLAGAKMLATDVLNHGDVPDSVATQMRKIATDFDSVGD